MAPVLLSLLALTSLVHGTAVAPALAKRNSGTATVCLGAPLGKPAHLASGVLYGIPINTNGTASTAIPDRFFTEMGFNFGRVGGAAFPAPNRGWVFGPSEYTYRFKAVLSNYRTARKFGAQMMILPHDLWGVDTAGTALPGDNGDWTQFDAFLTKLISDIKTNHMTPGLTIDIWNEPDLGGYGSRPQSQYLDMWGRAYARFRTELPTVLLAGPSTASPPANGNKFFNQWASFVKTNNSVPSTYTWHSLSKYVDPAYSFAYFNYLRGQVGLPANGININEYLAIDEEGPGLATWYIARLERLGIRGMRSNWAKYGFNATALHNYLANLLGPESGGPYYPNGEYQVYKYYANMTGRRISTSTSSDGIFEVYATSDNRTAGSVKILCAARGSTNPYTITVTGFATAGYGAGTIRKRSLGFNFNGVFGEVGAPVEFGVETHDIVNDQLSFDVVPQSISNAYAFELF